MSTEPTRVLEGLVAMYEARIDRLRAELESFPVQEPERQRLRQEIVGLVKGLDGAISRLGELKESVRPLVDRYRAMAPPRENTVPQPKTFRVDHLGSATYRERGWSALAGGDHERAVRELEKAIALDPENVSNRALLAWTYLRMERLDEARTLLDEVLAKDPAHSIGRMVRGYLRVLEGRHAEAIDVLTPVASEGTDSTATLYANLYLGMAHAGCGMYREAQGYFLHAVQLGPNLTEAYWELGRSHQREGREDLALAAWKAGGKNRFNPWGERCREAAERLEGG